MLINAEPSAPRASAQRRIDPDGIPPSIGSDARTNADLAAARVDGRRRAGGLKDDQKTDLRKDL